jgi:16S rRNA processing protein RimM
LNNGKDSPPPRLGLGRVARAHGIRGALLIRADAAAATTDPEVFIALEEVEIGGRLYRVLEAGRQKGQVLLRLAGVQTRNQAEELVGLEVRGEGSRFPALPPGEYYWFQLLGLPVLHAVDGSELGQLAEILPTPGHDVYVVRRGERELLLPAVEEVINEINLEEGWMKVTPPPGLLEAYAD